MPGCGETGGGVMEAGGGGGKGEDKGGYENDEGEGDTFVSYGSDADIAEGAVRMPTHGRRLLT